jgi:hypothetical protein
MILLGIATKAATRWMQRAPSSAAGKSNAAGDRPQKGHDSSFNRD